MATPDVKVEPHSCSAAEATDGDVIMKTAEDSSTAPPSESPDSSASLDRLEALLAKTQQFASFFNSTSGQANVKKESKSSSSKPRNRKASSKDASAAG